MIGWTVLVVGVAVAVVLAGWAAVQLPHWAAAAYRRLTRPQPRNGTHERRRVFDRTEKPAGDKAQREAAYATLSDGVLPRTEPVLAPLLTSTGRPVPDVLRPHPDGTCSICGDLHHAAAGHDMVMSILGARPEEPGWDVARLAAASLDDIAAAFDTSQFPAVTV